MSKGEVPRDFCLRACDCHFAVCCERDETAALISRVFAGLLVPQCQYSSAVRRYYVEQRAPSGPFRVSDGTDAVLCDGADDLLFYLDKSITLTLQRVRRDLFFVHAAVVSWNDCAVVLPASAGTGKSTLTLALLDHGLHYLSDELAPIDLDRLTVDAYPHALVLKSRPLQPYSLPDGTIEGDRRFHVPAHVLPARRDTLPVTAFVFLQRSEVRFRGLRPLTPASATARLMVHALNPLAHPGHGLDAAILLSQALPSFELDITDLHAATVAVKSVLQDGISPRPERIAEAESRAVSTATR